MSQRQPARRCHQLFFPTHFQRNTTGTIVYPLSIVQWTAINACEKPDVTFENTHIENLANAYICSICMELLTNPTSVGTCGHLFCRSCILSVIRAQNNRLSRRCPVCRDPFIVPTCIRAENHAKRVIGNFRIKCPNHQITDRHNALFSSRQRRQRNLDRARRERNRNRNSNSNSNNNNNARSRSRSRSRERNNNSNSNEENTISVFCEWSGEYRNLTQHLIRCELEIVSCIRCNIPILRREIASHDYNICPWLPLQCNVCRGRYLKCERMVHENICPMKVITCIYCTERYERKNMKTHWDTLCTKYPLHCQFKLHGCDEIVERENMEAHLNGNQLAHLQMISQRLTNVNGKYNELEEKYDELQENYEELEGTCNDLDDKCDELEQENEKLRTDHENLKEKVDALYEIVFTT